MSLHKTKLTVMGMPVWIEVEDKEAHNAGYYTRTVETAIGRVVERVNRSFFWRPVHDPKCAPGSGCPVCK